MTFIIMDQKKITTVRNQCNFFKNLLIYAKNFYFSFRTYFLSKLELFLIYSVYFFKLYLLNFFFIYFLKIIYFINN